MKSLTKSGKLPHYSNRLHRETHYRFHIYHIKPHAEGNALQIVGFAPEVNEMRMFKFEGITRIELLNNTYRIPSDFNADEFCKGCWSIWRSDKPETVELHFFEWVRERVKENRWHVLGRWIEHKDGSLSWGAVIRQVN